MKFLLLFLLPMSSFAQFDAVNRESLKPQINVKPEYFVEQPGQNNEIAIYRFHQSFTFESEAKKAAKKTQDELAAMGISVIGFNVFEKDGDYYFYVEYLPVLKQPESFKSFLIKTYRHGRSYWNKSSANLAMKETESFLSFSPIKPLELKLTDNEEYSFEMLYAVENSLKKSRNYYAVFEKINLGDFTFESEAKKSVSAFSNVLKNAGIKIIAAYPVENQRRYSLEFLVLNKTDDYKTLRPFYEIKNYTSLQEETFEKDAEKLADEKISVLSKSGLGALSSYSLKKDSDYVFSLDYVVKMKYAREFSCPEYEIKKYENPQSFNFKREAQEAMNEKLKNFSSANMAPLSWEITEKSFDYSFYIDYITLGCVSF